MIVGNAVIELEKESFVLIGRVLTEKNINFTAMQTVLSSVWRPKEGVEIHDIGDGRYSFVFYHPLDVQKVMEGGPWSFEQGMLVYKKLEGDEDPKEIVLNEAEIWIQVYNIPKGFVSETIFQGIANYIGCYVKSDPANLNGVWKSYYRIRVRMDVCQPLKRRMKIKKEGGEWSWIHFKYERLSTFCFVCGRLGHAERDCNEVYANPGKELERVYGTWLRAPGKNGKNESGSRWLRNGGNWNGSGGSSKMSAKGFGMEKKEAKVTEIGKSVTTNPGDNDRIMTIDKNSPVNQETKSLTEDQGGKQRKGDKDVTEIQIGQVGAETNQSRITESVDVAKSATNAKKGVTIIKNKKWRTDRNELGQEPNMGLNTELCMDSEEDE